MGRRRREIRIGLMLAAAACLVAVLVDWVVEELASEAPRADAEEAEADAEEAEADAEEAEADAEIAQASAEASPVNEADQASADTPPEDTIAAQDATEGARGQG